MNPLSFTKHPSPSQQQVLALQKELASAREDLRQAYLRFDQVIDDDLIEACIFQMNAAMAQCNYLVRTLKTYTPSLPAVDAVAAVSIEEQSTWS